MLAARIGGMKTAKECADRLRALADADRLRIVQMLRNGERTVSQIAARVELKLAMASHHLQILKRAGIVEAQKKGRMVGYRLCQEVIAESKCLDLGCCKLRLSS